MSTVKKAFESIHSFLESNKDKRIKDVLPELIELMSAKAAGGRAVSSVRRNEKGEVVEIFCYYHKMWEPVDKVDYGKKASSATGLSNMCKEGTAAWTKQQADAKKARGQLMDDVGDGTVKPSAIKATQAKIEATRIAVTPRKDKIGVPEVTAK